MQPHRGERLGVFRFRKGNDLLCDAQGVHALPFIPLHNGDGGAHARAVHILALLLDARVGKARAHVARHYGRDADAKMRKLASKREGQRVERKFRGRIKALEGNGEKSGHRACHNDRPAARFAQQGHGVARAGMQAEHVHVELAARIGEARALDGAGNAHAGVAHKNVQPALRLFNFAKRGLHLFFLRDVGREKAQPPVRGRRARKAINDIALVRKQLRRRKANAAGAARHGGHARGFRFSRHV